MNEKNYSRAIITFGKQCNLNCPFCYGYFDRVEINLENIFSILDNLKELNFTKISLAGGDPLLYPYIEDVINYANELNFTVDLDTNCFSFDEDKHKEILNKIDYLGVPIDGSNCRIHDSMRNKYGSFKKVLQVLNSVNCKVSINTVVTKDNYTDLANIYQIISNYKCVKQWHIYELLPLLVNDNYFKQKHIKYAEYRSIIDVVSTEKIELYCKPSERRLNSHIFISTSGELYCNNFDNQREYKSFGTIFDKKNIKRLLEEQKMYK